MPDPNPPLGQEATVRWVWAARSRRTMSPEAAGVAPPSAKPTTEALANCGETSPLKVQRVRGLDRSVMSRRTIAGLPERAPRTRLSPAGIGAPQVAAVLGAGVSRGVTLGVAVGGAWVGVAVAAGEVRIGTAREGEPAAEGGPAGGQPASRRAAAPAARGLPSAGLPRTAARYLPQVPP